jgi:hypothetical protein
MSTATFSVTTIDLSTNAPQLAPLSGREYTSEYTSLPNANLPKALRKDLDTIFRFLTGEELPLDENTFLIKSRDGVYFRLFGPVLKAGVDGVEGTSNGQLYVQWGPRYIPVNIVKGGFTLPDGTEIEAEFGSYNFSGRGEDPALFVSVDTEDGQLVLPVAVRFTDWENPTEPKALNALLKKKPEDVVALIQVVTAKGTGGGGQRVEADSEIDFRDLPVNEPFEVINYYPCKTSYGLTYRIAINNYPEEGQVAGAWAHSSIRPLLATKPEITREKPATLTVRSKEELDGGKIRLRSTLLLAAQEADDSALNLDF